MSEKALPPKEMDMTKSHVHFFCQVASIRILLLSIPRFLKRQTSVSVCGLKRRSSGVSVLRLVIQ